MLWSNGYSEYITTQKYIEWVFHRLSISFFLSFCISGFVVGVLCALLFSITLFKMRKTNEMYMHMDSLKRENNWVEFEWNRQKYWQKVKKNENCTKESKFMCMLLIESSLSQAASTGHIKLKNICACICQHIQSENNK